MTIPSASIVIIGGGITGVSIAESLAKRGETDVAVLEKDHLAAGSTGKSAGVIETQYLSEFDIELRAKSIQEFKRLASETRADFHQIGYIRLLANPEGEEQFRESIRIQQRYGVDDAKYLSADEVAELVPDLNMSDIHGAIYGPSDGYADPHTMAQVLAERASERGVHVLTGTEVVDVVTSGSQVRAVETSKGRITCDIIVNAAGPWAARLAKQVGLEIPAAPYRRQILVAEAEDSLNYTIPMVMEYTPKGNKPGLYFRQEGDEQVLMGLHREVGADESPVNPDRYDQSFDESFALDVFESLDQRAPRFTEFSVRNGWSGVYTITPDTEPIVDRHPNLDGYYIATGFSGKGFQLAPIVGDIVADLVLEGRPKIVDDISTIGLERFGDDGNQA